MSRRPPRPDPQSLLQELSDISSVNPDLPLRLRALLRPQREATRRLVTTASRRKPPAPATSSPSSADVDVSKFAMRVVNAGLATLTRVLQAPEDQPAPRQSFETISTCVRSALEVLRAGPDGGHRDPLLLERAAVTLVARCNALGLVRRSTFFI